MRPVLAVTLAAACLGLAAPAASAATDLNIKSNRLDVVMTKDGAAHVARFTYSGQYQQTVTVVVCRIPAGESACVQTASFTLPDGSVTTGPFIVSDGTKVVVAAGDETGSAERTYAAVSPNGTTWGSLSQVSNLTAEDVELAPSGDRLWLTAPYGPTGTSSDYLAFNSAPLPPAAPLSGIVLATASGGRTIGDRLVGIRPNGKPLAFASGDAPDLQPSGDYYKSFNGDPASNTDLNATGKWSSSFTRFDLAQPYARNGGEDVVSAYQRMWLVYKGLGADTQLRRFDGTADAFPATATNPDCVRSRFAAGLQQAPSVAIAPNGELLIAEVGSDTSQQHLGFFHGNESGTSFSSYQELASGPRIQDVEIAADPSGATPGVVVWTADGIYADTGAISFARLPSAAFAACPPAAATTPKTPTTTMPVTPVKPVTPITPPVSGTKTVKASVPGATLSFGVPKACVAAGSKYKVTLKFKRKKKKGNKFVKVSRVDFSAPGNKTKKDKKAPFSQTLTLKAGTKSGSKVTARARATIKVKRGRAPKKSITASVTVC